MCRHHVIIACAALTLLVGCAHKICLRAVDADTREPLAGVSAQWMQARVHMLQTLKQEGPTNLPASGPDGMIRVVGLHRSWTSDFIFTRPGYSNVYGVYGNGRLELATQIRHLPMIGVPDYFIPQGDVRKASKTDGCFLVEMHK